MPPNNALVSSTETIEGGAGVPITWVQILELPSAASAPIMETVEQLNPALTLDFAARPEGGKTL